MLKIIAAFLKAMRPFMPLNYTPKGTVRVTIAYISDGKLYKVNFPVA